jgi:biotin carboxyl carrier protein
VSRPLALRWEGRPVEAAFELRRPRAAVARDGGRFEAEVHADGSWVEIRGAGDPVRCAVSVSARQIWVACRGVTYVLERAQREAARQEGATSEDEIRAPMTGRVVRVAVTQGMAVRDGDLLLTIEAMKMEFKLTAPEDGTVAEIRCAEGDRVELGQLLARLLPEAAAGAGSSAAGPAGPAAT